PVPRLCGSWSACINLTPAALAISNTGTVNANRIRQCRKTCGRVKARGNGLTSPLQKRFSGKKFRHEPEQERGVGRLERGRTARSLHPKGGRKARPAESERCCRRTTSGVPANFRRELASEGTENSANPKRPVSHLTGCPGTSVKLDGRARQPG